jgi:hypothetical protein
MPDQSTLAARTSGETENPLRALLLRTSPGTDLDDHGWVALLTSRGAALFELNAQIGRLTNEIWTGIEQRDLAAAYIMPTTILERTNALLVQ